MAQLQTDNADVKAGISIVLKALEAPIRQIAANAGVEGSIVESKVIENASETFGFDARTETYGDLVEAGLLNGLLRAAVNPLPGKLGGTVVAQTPWPDPLWIEPLTTCLSPPGPRRVTLLRRGRCMALSSEFRRRLEGYSLTTAEILYHLPDHPHLLQTFVWQQHDLFPRFPELKRFLAFWQERLDGPLHSVRVMHSRLIKPAELKTVSGEFHLH